MNIRHVPVARGVDWIKNAVNIGSRNPRAVFGAAALFLSSLYLVSVLAVLPVAAQLQGRAQLSFAESIAFSVPLLCVLAVMTPVLLAGLMHVMHEAEAGRPVRSTALFTYFRRGELGSLMALGAVQVLLNIAGVAVLYFVTGPEFIEKTFKAVQAAMSGQFVQPPEPRHPTLMFFVQLLQLAINYLSAALMLLCVPLIALSRARLVESLTSGLRASVVNIAPNLLASMLFVVGLVVATLVVALITAVVGGIATLIHPVLGAIFALLVWLLFALVVLVVIVAASYYAWRDMFEPAGDASTPPAPRMHIEA